MFTWINEVLFQIVCCWSGEYEKDTIVQYILNYMINQPDLVLF